MSASNLINVFCFIADKHPEARDETIHPPTLSEVAHLPLPALMLPQTPVLLLHRWGSHCSHACFHWGEVFGSARDPHRIGQDEFDLGASPAGNTDRPAPLGGVSV